MITPSPALPKIMSSSNNTTTNPTIRHAGHAHIRGKIRRVWRPRYLELDDTGWLRYYELISAEQQEERVHKYNLQVQHARILDVTTIRDLHTGLPSGLYGFVFGGKRYFSLEPSPHQRLVVLPHNSCTDYYDATAAEVEERDYLCAVESLEEAQMWVIALQWAASQTKTQQVLKRASYDESSWETPGYDELEQRHIVTKSADTIPVVPKTTIAPPKRMVVTKVVGRRLIRTNTWTWQYAFDIRGLLVLLTNNNESSRICEWTVYRTPLEIQNLLRKLRQTPLLRERLSKASLDRWLRRWLLDPAVVNTKALKEFLGVPSIATTQDAVDNTHKQPPLPWWTVQEANRVVAYHNLPVTTSPEQSVKEWLRMKHDKNRFEVPIWCYYAVGGGVASWVVPRLATTVSLRLDILVVSWMGAASIGYWYARQEVSNSRTTITSTNKRTVIAANTSPDNDPEDDDESDGEEIISSQQQLQPQSQQDQQGYLPSPIPRYPDNKGVSCWSQPDSTLFFVRGPTYLQDRVKIPSGPVPLTCRGVDVWMTDTPVRHIARHEAVLGGRLGETDTFLVNFLLPFGNLVAYFSIPPLRDFPPVLQTVWTKFLQGDQQYRDARLKLLPVVTEGPWIVKTAVGPGKSPAVLGRVIPLQYFFHHGDSATRAVYEVDVIITASSIAKGILSVVKGHTKSVSIAFAFIVEGVSAEELPETVLACFQIHSLHLEDCPMLPPSPREENQDVEEYL